MTRLFGIAFMAGFFSMLFGGKGQAELPKPDSLPSQAELPDPLKLFYGGDVTTTEVWYQKRKPELKTLFQHYMYGQLPPTPTRISATVLHEDKQAFGGKATLQEVAIGVGPEADAPKFNVLLVIPNGKAGKVPVFVGPNFSGNYTLVDDPKVQRTNAWVYPNQPGSVKNQATEAGRGAAKEVWNIDLAIERGYAIATFYNGDIDPDRLDAREGMRPYLDRITKVETTSIACWAWAVHRVVDHLVSLPQIDSKRIACVGHSRLGKTALLAGAFDERIALVIPHQAGCGGTAPSRGKIGESVKQINDRFPHWFNSNFKFFNGDTSKLPFDQHCLLALCAPRPVLYSNAIEDTWANPDGQFEMLKAAAPVYKLLTSSPVEVKKEEVGKLADGKLGYFVRAGKHSMNRQDWIAFLDFADKHLGKPE
jgi:hypothetical protein